VVSVDVNTFSQHYLVAMSTSLDKLEKSYRDPSSARNALSYGVKIAKIGPVDLEIRPNKPIFGHVIPDVHK